MYEKFFGLSRNPFAMTPDPSFMFVTTSHREALAGLSYAVVKRKGFAVLTGDAGTGKTTVLTSVIGSLSGTHAHFSVVLNPTVTPAEFFEMALLDFGLTDIPASKAQRIVQLQKILVESNQAGKTAVLIVDEAHKLSPEVLEEIRLLTNFETDQGKLLQIVLAGQPELDTLLERDDLRQLRQRIAVRLGLRPLAEIEVEQYLSHRWSKVTARPLPFSASAISLIAKSSGGIPRVVNSISDNALLLSFACGIPTVEYAAVAEAIADLRILPAKPEFAAPQLRVPRPGSLPFGEARSVNTLGGRQTSEQKPSFARRWAGKLGLVQ